jgi:membrane-associated protease RseP (regulator of RpoE activity)
MNDASEQPTPEPTEGHGPEFSRAPTRIPPVYPLPGTEFDYAELVSANDGRFAPKRMRLLPAILFLTTCLSTFWVGVSLWSPDFLGQVFNAINNGSLLEFRQKILAHWDSGLIYMGSVMLILLLHELGHFIATIYYRVPASFPFFLPFPANPIGTLGAVIGMQGALADRKQIFDIGIAGPLAGLVAAVPIAYFGVSQLDLTTQPYGGFGFRLPLLLDWFAKWTNVPGYETGDVVWMSQLNALFVAGWVGMLITGLNMMPIGQLDGGHITYTMFGKAAHWIAQATIVFAIAYMVYHNNFMLILMVMLLLLMGPNHPPTRDDTVPLGPFRYALGLTSLVIPILCFPPQIFKLAF